MLSASFGGSEEPEAEPHRCQVAGEGHQTGSDPDRPLESQADGVGDAEQEPEGIEHQALIVDALRLVAPAQPQENEPAKNGKEGKTDHDPRHEGAGPSKPKGEEEVSHRASTRRVIVDQGQHEVRTSDGKDQEGHHQGPYCPDPAQQEDQKKKGRGHVGDEPENDHLADRQIGAAQEATNPRAA